MVKLNVACCFIVKIVLIGSDFFNSWNCVPECSIRVNCLC